MDSPYIFAKFDFSLGQFELQIDWKVQIDSKKSDFLCEEAVKINLIIS